MYRQFKLFNIFTFAWLFLASVGSATVTHVYVDCNATLPGQGTQELPYHEICDAFRYVGDLPAGTVMHVHVAPGVYRETLAKAGWYSDEADLIIEGDPVDRPIILGSDQFEDWTHALGAVYRDDWTNDFYSGTPPYNENDLNIRHWLYGDDPSNEYRATYLLRREGVWVNGERLRQILHRNEAGPGKFMVDQDNDRMYIWCADGSWPGSHEIEVSVREYGANFYHMNNVTLRNMEFRYARAGIFASSCNSVTVENCYVEENVHEGIAVGLMNGFTVRNTTVIRNGYSGIQPSFVENITLEDVNVWENNWRGADVGAGDWRVGGMKLYAVSNVYMNNVDARDNLTSGIWFDRFCEGVLMEDCKMVSNYGTGLFWEISPGPIELVNCEIHFNGSAINLDPELITTTSGILINSGANLSATNCDFDGNLPYNMEIANSGRTAMLWRDGALGESDPIDVTGLQIASCTFNHYLPLDQSVYCPDWLDPASFWTSAITVTPQALAEQIVPMQYRGGLDNIGGGDMVVYAAPNPSNATIVLSVDLPHATDMVVDLYDVLGRRVQTYSYIQLPQGLHKTHINGRDLASGTYFARVSAGAQTVATHKLMFVK